MEEEASELRTVEEKAPLSWTSHPARESGRKTALLIGFLLFVWVSVYFWAGGFWTFLAVVLLGGSVSPYFAVTRYELDSSGVMVFKTFYKIEKNWSAFRSYYPDKSGVLLSPFREPSRLENFRGLYLRFSANRDEVLDYVSRKIEMP